MKYPTKVTFTVNLSSEERTEIRRQAFLQDCSVSEIFRRAVRKYIEEHLNESENG